MFSRLLEGKSGLGLGSFCCFKGTMAWPHSLKAFLLYDRFPLWGAFSDDQEEHRPDRAAELSQRSS